jgi:NADPH:quinone reductase-like Zn-dependent oxidoreductase
MNPIDYKLVDMLTEASAFPFVPGIDFAGIIERIPDGNHGFEVGERVFGMARTCGSYAAYTAIDLSKPGEPFARTPDTLSDEQAASLPVAGVAALGGLEFLQIQPGQRLVIIGASGGVGGYATQIARARGAYVIGASYSNSAEARSLGANAAFDAQHGNVFDAIRGAYPDGVDGVLDLVNEAELIVRNVEIIKPGGRIASALRTADPKWFEKHQIVAHNITAASNPASSPAGLARLAELAVEGLISPRIRSVIQLDEVEVATAQLRQGGTTGKFVIRL